MNTPFSITHHGAIDGVTGSCHQLTLSDGQSVLIDCGLFQGAPTINDPIEFASALQHALQASKELIETEQNIRRYAQKLHLLTA